MLLYHELLPSPKEKRHGVKREKQLNTLILFFCSYTELQKEKSNMLPISFAPGFMVSLLLQIIATNDLIMQKVICIIPQAGVT